VITEEEIDKALDIIKTAMEELPTLKGTGEDKVIPQAEKGIAIKIEN
jgi:ornithine--oxo-acid transaminase